MQVNVCESYVAPETRRQSLVCEGCFCASRISVKADSKVEVDEWVPIENEVTFE